MVTDVNINPGYRSRVHPQKFALWLSFASIIMMFGALTSAYIVKQAAGNWLEFALPMEFIFSTIAIVASSICLHVSFKAFQKRNRAVHKYGLIAGFILGITFVVLQYFGWNTLFSVGVDLKGNASGSFFYLITGLHAVHVLGGIAALCVALYHTFSLPFNVTVKRVHRYELVVQYWHFVDILWLYLLIFLVFVK